MSSCGAAVYPDKIAFGNNLINGITKIWDGLKYGCKEFNESVSTLRAIGVVLDIILSYELIQVAQVMIDNDLSAKSFNKFFIRLRGIHEHAPIIFKLETNHPIRIRESYHFKS
jgi:hypothetical protein